jgi:hypothetical protein
MRNRLCIQNRLGRDVACQWLHASLGYVRDASVGTRRRGKSDGCSILGCVDEAVGVNFCNVCVAVGARFPLRKVGLDLTKLDHITLDIRQNCSESRLPEGTSTPT